MTRIESQWTSLQSAMRAGDAQGVFAALDGTSEEERAVLHQRLKELLSKDERPLHKRSKEEQLVAGVLAADCGSELLDFVPSEDGLRMQFAVMLLRPVAWRLAWRDEIMATEWGVFAPLLLAVREGVCPAPAPPTTPEQRVAAHAKWLGLPNERWAKGAGLADLLRAQPWTLSWPVDLLFDLEGSGDRSLAAVDKYLSADASWSACFLSLVENGDLDRQRILDATLRAMASDFSAFRAGWFQRFFRDLSITSDEAIERRDALLGLLSSAVPATATTALSVLQQLQSAGCLDGDSFLASAGPCLLHKAKKTPLHTLKMIAATVETDVRLAPRAATTATIGLSHPHVEVQSKVLAFLESVADGLTPEGLSSIAEHVPLISATLAGRAASLVVGTGVGATPPTPSPLELTSDCAFKPRPPATELPTPVLDRVPAGDPIVPVASLGELILEATRHLEAPHELAAEERLLDGCLRFAPPAAGSADRTTLLKAAQRTKAKGWGEGYGKGQDAAELCAEFLLLWLGEGSAKRLEDASVEGHPGNEVFRLRRAAVVERFSASGGDRLWSFPTHADGAIEGAEAKARWAACPLPEGDPDRVILWARATVELAPATATTSAHTNLEVKARGTKPHVWSWLEADPQTSVAMPRVPGSLMPPNSGHLMSSWKEMDAFPDPLHMRSAGSLCVRYPDAAMHLAARAIAANLDFAEARWANRHFLEPLLWPEMTLGPLGHSALAIALSAKETQERAIGIDACIEAAEEGRAGAEVLGQKIAWLLPTGLGRPQRLAAALAAVAAASSPHAEFVGRVLVASLELNTDQKPRGIASLLALLVEVQAMTELRFVSGPALAYLASFKGSSKAAKMSKTILATIES